MEVLVELLSKIAVQLQKSLILEEVPNGISERW